MRQNLNINRNEIYNNKNKIDFDLYDRNEFIKDNYKADFNQRNVLYIGNLNNMNNFQKSTLTNDQNTRKTNYKPRNLIFQDKNNFDISAGKNNNGFYRSYDKTNMFNSKANNKNNISSPHKNVDDILFIPCINCNQLIKVDHIEQHSEICIAYSNDADNASRNDNLHTSIINRNLNGETIKSANKFALILDDSSKRNNINSNNYVHAEGSNNTGKFGFSNINSFANSKKIISHDFSNQKNVMMNSNTNFNAEATNFDKDYECNNGRLSNYSNNLVINSNSFIRNEGAAGFTSNLNSFLDLISENDTSNSIRNTKFRYSNEELIYRNRVINEKLNKILCQINEVDFRMNVNISEEHYIFSIESYLLDSISI